MFNEELLKDQGFCRNLSYYIKLSTFLEFVAPLPTPELAVALSPFLGPFPKQKVEIIYSHIFTTRRADLSMVFKNIKVLKF